MDIAHVLKSSKTLCVIGCSDQPGRAGHDIPALMRKKGYRILPVNPKISEVFGNMSYPSMLDIPADIQIDIVVIFRNPRFTAQAVSEVVLWKKRSGQNPVIWTQFGVSTPEAATLAEQAGLAYVENACIAVEYVKYVRN